MRGQCYISISFLTCFGKKPSLMRHISKIDHRHVRSRITRFRMKYFWGKKPDISHLEEFGKKCWVLQQNEEISKLDPKSKQFIFVGIGDGTKGYRYYNPKTHQTLTSRNVI